MYYLCIILFRNYRTIITIVNIFIVTIVTIVDTTYIVPSRYL